MKKLGKGRLRKTSAGSAGAGSRRAAGDSDDSGDEGGKSAAAAGGSSDVSDSNEDAGFVRRSKAQQAASRMAATASRARERALKKREAEAADAELEEAGAAAAAAAYDSDAGTGGNDSDSDAASPAAKRASGGKRLRKAGGGAAAKTPGSGASGGRGGQGRRASAAGSRGRNTPGDSSDSAGDDDAASDGNEGVSAGHSGALVAFPPSAKAAIDPSSPYAADWHVHWHDPSANEDDEEGAGSGSSSSSGVLLTCKLRRPGPSGRMDEHAKYFHLQLLRRDRVTTMPPNASSSSSAGAGGKRKGAAVQPLPPFLLLCRWGRVGSNNPGQSMNEYYDQQEAVAAFYRMYSEKTGGNAFGSSGAFKVVDGAYSPADEGDTSNVGSGIVLTQRDAPPPPPPAPTRTAADRMSGSGRERASPTSATEATSPTAPVVTAPKKDPAAVLKAAAAALTLPAPSSSAPPIRLQPEIAELMQLLASPQGLIDAVTACGADAASLSPQLGLIPDSAFRDASRALRKIASALSGSAGGSGSGRGGGTTQLLEMLSRDLNAIFPFAIPSSSSTSSDAEPPPITSRSDLIARTRMVQSLWGLNTTARLLRTVKASPALTPLQKVHPLEAAYLHLRGTALAPLDQDADVSRELRSLLEGTNDAEAGPFSSLSLVQGYEVRSVVGADLLAGCLAAPSSTSVISGAGAGSSSSSSSSAGSPSTGASTRCMLWYAGPDTPLDVLSHSGCLRLPPADLPASGFPFGRGLYLTPIASHALQATGQGAPNSTSLSSSSNGSASTECLLLLCEAVVPGKEHITTKRNTLTSSPAGTVAVKVAGQRTTNSANTGPWPSDMVRHLHTAAAGADVSSVASSLGMSEDQMAGGEEADINASHATASPQVAWGPVVDAPADEGVSSASSSASSSEAEYDQLVLFDACQARVRYVLRVRCERKPLDAPVSAAAAAAVPEEGGLDWPLSLNAGASQSAAGAVSADDGGAAAFGALSAYDVPASALSDAFGDEGEGEAQLDDF